MNSKNQRDLNFIIGNIVLNACLKANLAWGKLYLSLTTPYGYYFDNESFSYGWYYAGFYIHSHTVYSWDLCLILNTIVVVTDTELVDGD